MFEHAQSDSLCFGGFGAHFQHGKMAAARASTLARDQSWAIIKMAGARACTLARDQSRAREVINVRESVIKSVP